MRQRRQNQPATPAALTWGSGGGQTKVGGSTIAAPQQSASPPPLKNERGTFEFLPGEKIAAFVLGALVWFALAYGNQGVIVDAFALPSSDAPHSLVWRLFACAARNGFIGPITVAASVGAAFFARFLRRVPVRGLSRWTCFVLSAPLFQVLGIACITSTMSDVLYPVIGGLIAVTGFLLLMASASVSLEGGVYVLLEAQVKYRASAPDEWRYPCFGRGSWFALHRGR